MSEMTERMSEAGAGRAPEGRRVGSPKKGERYRCGTCGMEVQVTADCRCDDPNRVHFHCCGKELQKA